MLKVCTLFKRKPGLTIAEYQAYWTGEHPKFVRRLPGLRGYTQNRPLPETFEWTPSPPYDGLVELWFDDSAALKTLSTTREYEDLNRDEEQFVDRSSIRLILTDEKVLKARAPESEKLVKRVSFFKRATGIAPEEFQRRIVEEYGAEVAVKSDVLGYVQSLPRLRGYRADGEPEWDMIDMCWFANLDTALKDPAATRLAGLLRDESPPRLYTRENQVMSISNTIQSVGSH
jgi:uncharacterized protein (TIGR02118 family)